MIQLRISLLILVAGCLAWGSSSPGQARAVKTYLVDVAKGQLPGDTGTDKTRLEIVDHHKELGGKALQVAFAPGDSFGNRATAGNKNWKPFAAFRCNAFNPAKEVVVLELNVVHAASTNYQTRVVVPFELKPGKNSVRIALLGLTNVNGSAPDLANVVRWYIANSSGQSNTVFFGDLWLDAGEPTVAPNPLVGERTLGKVGSDPARLARVRAAKMPAIDKPILFYTPEADAICSALEVFPPNNPWNLVVEDWPLHPNSKNIIASIGAEKPLRYNDDMGFILVPPDQEKVDVKIVGYPDESDGGPFPVPDNVPIEGWPSFYQRTPQYKNLTLDDVQRDTLKQGGDRHAIVVDPVNRMLYEFFAMRKTEAGWQAEQASIFDLKSNRLRPDGWTSADAAGLPIFPAVVRYDELQRGIVEHAMRVTVKNTRRDYVYPARHFASKHTDENMPRMGERIRLRRDFDIAGFRPEIQAILKGLKKYGMFVADNGIDWAISVAPDPRIPVLHEELRKIKGANFEVVLPPPGYQPPEN